MIVGSTIVIVGSTQVIVCCTKVYLVYNGQWGGPGVSRAIQRALRGYLATIKIDSLFSDAGPEDVSPVPSVRPPVGT